MFSSPEPSAVSQGQKGVCVYLLWKGIHAEVSPSETHGHSHRREEPHMSGKMCSSVINMQSLVINMQSPELNRSARKLSSSLVMWGSTWEPTAKKASSKFKLFTWLSKGSRLETIFAWDVNCPFFSFHTGGSLTRGSQQVFKNQNPASQFVNPE